MHQALWQMMHTNTFFTSYAWNTNDNVIFYCITKGLVFSPLHLEASSEVYTYLLWLNVCTLLASIDFWLFRPNSIGLEKPFLQQTLTDSNGLWWTSTDSDGLRPTPTDSEGLWRTLTYFEILWQTTKDSNRLQGTFKAVQCSLQVHVIYQTVIFLSLPSGDGVLGQLRFNALMSQSNSQLVVYYGPFPLCNVSYIACHYIKARLEKRNSAKNRGLLANGLNMGRHEAPK